MFSDIGWHYCSIRLKIYLNVNNTLKFKDTKVLFTIFFLILLLQQLLKILAPGQAYRLTRP